MAPRVAMHLALVGALRASEVRGQWGQLQLEQSTWSTHAFVERVASTRLHMATPDPALIQVVQP